MSNPGKNMHRARELAKTHELYGFDFLNIHGRMGARGKNVAQVRLIFAPKNKAGDTKNRAKEQVTILLTPLEMNMLKGVSFNLRSVLDDA